MADKDTKIVEEKEVQEEVQEKVEPKANAPKPSKFGAKEIIPCYVQSRKDKNVTIAYDGKDCILAPRQKMYIPDKSKLSKVNPRDILITKG